MTLTEAKEIAANPSGFSPDLWQSAYDRLAQTRVNGGVRNSERATERLERRLAKLSDYIASLA